MGRRRQERHKDLEWFGLPERNTLRPLGSCIDLGLWNKTLICLGCSSEPFCVWMFLDLRACECARKSACVRALTGARSPLYLKGGAYTERGPGTWARPIGAYSMEDMEIFISSFSL
jgi:hypothetical protein